MALNFLGLGFSFGAKDLGLKKMQTTLIAGFTSLSLEIRRLSESLTGVKLGTVLDQLPTDELNKQSAAIRGLADSMEGQLPAAATEAATAMRDAGRSTEKGSRQVTSGLTGMAGLGVHTQQTFSDMSKTLREDLPEAIRKAAMGFTRDGTSIWSMERKIRDGFDWIRNASEKLNSILRINKLQLFIQSLDLLKLQNVGNAIQHMVSDGGQLTTSLEAQAAAYNKTARTIATSMSGSAADVRRYTSQMTGMAIGLNVDVTAVGQAFAAVQRTTGDVAQLGFRDMQSLVKATQVVGVSADDLVGMMQNLQVSWGMSTEGAKGLLDEVTAIGQSMGFGVGAVQNMQRTVAAMDESFAQFAQNAPEQTRRLILSTTALQGAFVRMGMGEEAAGTAATDLLKKLTSERAGFERMFTGLESELPALSQQFGITTGDISQAFSLLREDPLQFAISMRQMTKRVEESGGDASFFMTRMSQVMSDHLGPSFAWLAKGAIDPAMGSLEQLAAQIAGPGGIAGSGGAFDKMVRNGFSTGRTLQETMDLMRENFVLRLRSMNKEAVQKFVRNTGTAFRDWGDKITALAKEDGPLGALARKMILVQQVGAKGLLPTALQPMAEVFGQLLQMAGPFVGMLGVMGVRFGFLASPLGLVLGGIGGLAVAMRTLTSHNVEADEAVVRLRNNLSTEEKALRRLRKGTSTYIAQEQKVEGIRRQIEEARSKAREGAASQAREQIRGFFKSIKEKIPVIVGVVSTAVQEIWTMLKEFFREVDWGEVLQSVVSLGKAVWNFLSDVFGSIDWGKVFSTIGKGIKAALPVIGDFFVDLGEGLWEGVSGQFDPNSSKAAQSGVFKIAGYIGQSLKLAVVYAWDFFTKKVIPFVLDFVHGLFNGLIFGADPSKGGKTKAQQMGQAIGAWIQNALVLAWKWLKDYMSKWWGTITSIWTDPSTTFMEKVKATFASSAGIIIGAFALYKFTPVFGVLKMLGSVGLTAGRFVFQGAKLVAEGATAAVRGVAFLGAKLTTLVSGGEMAASTLGRLGQTMVGVWKGSKALLTKVVELGAALAYRLAGGTKLALDGVGQFAPTMAAAQKGVGGFTGLIPKMVAGLKTMGMAMWTALGPWGLLLAAIAAVGVALAIAFPNEAKAGIMKAWNAIKSGVENIWNGIKGFVQGVLLYFKGMWNILAGGAEIFENAVKATLKIVSGLFKTVFYSIIGIVGGVFRTIGGIVATVYFAIKAIVQGFYYFFTGQWDKLGEVFSSFWNSVKGVWESVGQFFKEVWGRVWEGIESVVRAFVGFFTSSIDAVKRVALGVWDAIRGAGYALFNALKVAINIFTLPFRAAFEYLSSFAGQIWRGIESTARTAYNAVAGIWEGVEQLGRDLYRWFVEPVVDAFDEIYDAAVWLYKHTIGIFGDIGNFIYDLFGGSPQDAPIQAFQDVGTASTDMAGQVTQNVTGVGKTLESMGTSVNKSMDDVFVEAANATARYYNRIGGENQKFLESFDGGWAQFRMDFASGMQEMASKGVHVNDAMMDDITRRAHQASVDASTNARRMGAGLVEASQVGRDAWKETFDAIKAEQIAIAQMAEESARRQQDYYRSTTAEVRNFFDNARSEMSDSTKGWLDKNKDAEDAIRQMMARASREGLIRTQDDANAMMKALQTAAVTAYEGVQGANVTAADRTAAAVGEMERTVDARMDALRESARATAEQTTQTQQSISQTASQEMLETPRITSRTVRQIAAELKIALQIIKTQMDAMVIWVSGFAANVLGKINQATTPLMDKINQTTAKWITRLADVTKASNDTALGSTKVAEEGLKKMEGNLDRATRTVVQKTGTVAEKAMEPMLGLPKTVEEEVTKKIVELFVNMWSEIETATAGIVAGLSNQMTGLIRDLSIAMMIQQSIATSRRAMAVAEAGGAETTGTYVAPRESTAGEMPEVIDAINRPAWYYEDYAEQFDRQMVALAAAIRGRGPQGGSQSGTTQRRRASEAGN